MVCCCQPFSLAPCHLLPYYINDQIRRHAHCRLRQLSPRLGQLTLGIKDRDESHQTLPITIGRQLQADPVDLHRARQSLPAVLIRPV